MTEASAHTLELYRERQAAVGAIVNDTDLLPTVKALRIWQSQRLRRTYADLARKDRYALALDFFTEDIYGPELTPPRDRDLDRAMPILRRALPKAPRRVLDQALELETLTLHLDRDVARAIPDGTTIDDDAYAAAYREAGRPKDRARQIDLLLVISEELYGIVRSRMVLRLLHASKRPAHAAGFGELHDFFERGADAFAKLLDDRDFITVIADRERKLMLNLFEDHPDPFGFLPGEEPAPQPLDEVR